MTKSELKNIVDQLQELQSEGLYEFDSPEDRAISEVISILEDTANNI